MSNPTAGQDLSTVKNSNIYRFQNILQFVLLSVIGAFIFFVSFELNGVNTIPLDHLVTFLNKTVPIFGPLLTMIVCIIGGALPFINKTWKKIPPMRSSQYLRSLRYFYRLWHFLN